MFATPARLRARFKAWQIVSALIATMMIVAGSVTANAADSTPTVRAALLDDVVVALIKNFPASTEVNVKAEVTNGSGNGKVKTSGSGFVAIGFSVPEGFQGNVKITATAGDTTASATVKVGGGPVDTTAPTTAAPTTSTTATPTTSTTVKPTTTTTAVQNPTGETKFTFAVMPDTQGEVFGTDPRFKQRTQWLADNKTALNLKFVSHSGDVVNWGWLDENQYKIASAAMVPLKNAGIPYTLAIGNHDTAAVGVGGSAYDTKRTRQLVRDTAAFNKYFKASDFGSVAGQFEANKVDNLYSIYNAGGKKWMVMTLELWPRTEVVTWANKVVAANPDANVIVVTHSYLNSDGSIYGGSDYGANSPQYVFDNLIKKHANIKMVLSGHVGQAASRTDKGDAGNTIFSFMETFHAKTNPVRLVEVDTRADSLKTWIYTPSTKTTESQYTETKTGLKLIG